MDDDFDRGFDAGRDAAVWMVGAIGLWPAGLLTLIVLFAISFAVVTTVQRRR